MVGSRSVARPTSWKAAVTVATALFAIGGSATASRLRLVAPRRSLSNASPVFAVSIEALGVGSRLVHQPPRATCSHRRHRYVRALSSTASGNDLSAAPATPANASLVPVSDDDIGRPVGEVLKERLAPNHPRFFFAKVQQQPSRQDQDGTMLELDQPIPPGADTIEALTLESDDPTARYAFWLSSAYLLGMAIRETLGQRVLLSASPTLNATGAGGAGFAYEYLVRSDVGADVLASSSSPSSSSAEATKAVIELVGSQTAKAGFSDAEIRQVEKRVEKLAASNLKLRRDSVSLDEARRLFASNPFKAERVEAIAHRHANNAIVPIVRIGDAFVDLLPSLGNDAAGLPLLVADTKPIKAIKITDWSAATWTPSDPSSAVQPPANQALTRLRAVSFASSAQLKAHLAAQQAALASDHRSIGKSQALFFTHESSPGTPFVLPHGMRLARKVERVVRDLYDIYGYDEVQSPQLYRSWLWKKSGHWDNYRDDMFASEGYKERIERRSIAAATSTAVPSVPSSTRTAATPTTASSANEVGATSSLEGRTACCSIHTDQANDGGTRETSATSNDHHDDLESFGLKPMNCPGHCLIFASQERSYRDLPIRYAEFSPLHRNEASGSLSGLTRVRRFHQDDAHVFCRPDQVGSEIASMLHMLSTAYEAFGFQRFELVLSTRPAAFIGKVAEWDAAEQGLKTALDSSGRSWTLNEADGAFYGPKIDIRLVDAAGRKHQTATIQLDFQLPQRFDLSYTDAHGGRTGNRPVMIHRAILGSVERFMAILIEQTSGWWPFWLSPRQAVVLPASRDPAVLEYAQTVRDHLALGYHKRSPQNTSDAGNHPTTSHSSAQPAPWPTPLSPAEMTRHPRTLQRFHVDLNPHASEQKLAKLVRSAQLARYNFLLVVGEAERSAGTVHVRPRDDTHAPEGIRKLQERDRDRAVPAGSYGLEELRERFCRLDCEQSW